MVLCGGLAACCSLYAAGRQEARPKDGGVHSHPPQDSRGVGASAEGVGEIYSEGTIPTAAPLMLRGRVCWAGRGGTP